MKTLIKFIGLLSLVILLVFCSCSKNNENDTPPEKTTTELLTAGFWNITAMTIDPGVLVGTTVITDVYAQWDNCEKDDLMRFDSDGKITDDEGATKCDINDPQTKNDGTWVLSANGESVSIAYPGEATLTFVIATLNGSTLSGTYTLEQDFGAGPLTYTYTVTMKLQ